MKIAITGATGSLGRSLTEYYLAHGIRPVILGRNKNVGAELQKRGADFRPGDLLDAEYVREAFRGCELVIHSAGLASPWGKWEDFYNSNVVATQNVLDAIRDNGIRKLIYLSTPSLYFSGKPFSFIREDDVLPPPQTMYSKSKLMADELVLKATHETGLSSTLLRPRSIIGKYDSAILPRFMKVMKRGKFPLPDGGKAIVDVTAVENVIAVVELIRKSPENFRGEIFNISNGESMSVRDLTGKVARHLNLPVKFISLPSPLLFAAARAMEAYANHISHKEPLISLYSIQSLAVSQTLNIDKIRHRLGWKSVISIDEALKKLAEDIKHER